MLIQFTPVQWMGRDSGGVILWYPLWTPVSTSLPRVTVLPVVILFSLRGRTLRAAGNLSPEVPSAPGSGQEPSVEHKRFVILDHDFPFSFGLGRGNCGCRCDLRRVK